MKKIRLLHSGINIAAAKQELADNPEVWDVYPHRRGAYGPHSELSDVWVRYAAPDAIQANSAVFSDEHDSVWYPEAEKLPAVKELVFSVMAAVNGERLGGVLITKIPAGKQCAPHVDTGWHARYYDKFAVQIAANDYQEFCFEGEKLITRPGDLFTFDNSFTHWVTNNSDESRITLIICIRNQFSKEYTSCRGE